MKKYIFVLYMSNLNIKIENHADLDVKANGNFLTVYATKASQTPTLDNSFIVARPNVFSVPMHIHGNAVGRFRGTGRVEEVKVEGMTENSLVQVRLVGFTKDAINGIDEPIIDVKPFGFTHTATLGALYLYTVYFA